MYPVNRYPKLLAIVLLSICYVDGFAYPFYVSRKSSSRIDRCEYYAKYHFNIKNSLYTTYVQENGLYGVKYEGNTFIYPQYKNVWRYNCCSYTLVQDDEGWFFVDVHNKPLFDERFESILLFDYNTYRVMKSNYMPYSHKNSRNVGEFFEKEHQFPLLLEDYEYNTISTPFFRIHEILPEYFPKFKNTIEARNKGSKHNPVFNKYHFLFFAQKDGKWGLANGEGKWVVEPRYEYVYNYLKSFKQCPEMYFFCGDYSPDNTVDGRIFDILGNEVRSFKKSCVEEVTKNYNIATDKFDKLNSKEWKMVSDSATIMAYLDMQDSLAASDIRVLQRLDTIRPAISCYARKNVDGKWGFVSVSGKELTGYVYDEVVEQVPSHAYRVSKNGKYGVVNFRGEVIPCMFEFIQPWDSIGNSIAYYSTNKNGELRLYDCNINEWGYCGLTLERYVSGKFTEVYDIDSSNYCNLNLLANYLWRYTGRDENTKLIVGTLLNSAYEITKKLPSKDVEAYVWYNYTKWDLENLKNGTFDKESYGEYIERVTKEREERERQAALNRPSSFDSFLNSFISFSSSLYNVVQATQGSNYNSSVSGDSGGSGKSSSPRHNVHPGMSQSELQNSYNYAISNIRTIKENWHNYIGTHAEVSQRENLRSIKATISRIKKSAAEHGVRISTDPIESWEPPRR